MISRSNKSVSGQSLMEITVVLGITVVVAVALVIVVVTSLRNAQFAQNQAKATKYAQQALDQIKALRDRDQGFNVVFATNNAATSAIPQCDTAFCDPLHPGENCKFKSLWSCHLTQISPYTSPCTVSPTAPPISGCYFKLSTDGKTLQEPNMPNNLKEDLKDGLFREIKITDLATSSATEKTVTVKVSWSDASGSHESNLETILTNY